MERCSSLWLYRGSAWVITFLGLLIFLRELVTAVIQVVSFVSQTCCCQQWSAACPEQHANLRVLLQDRSQLAGVPYGQRTLGSGPWVAVRILESLLLLSGPFLSKFLGEWLWRVNIHAVKSSGQSLICTNLGCSVRLFHTLPSAQERRELLYPSAWLGSGRWGNLSHAYC